MSATRWFCGAFIACVLAACVANIEEQPSLIERPSVIALITEPPDVLPGEATSVSAVIAAPIDVPVPALATWSWCTAPAPLTDNRSVGDACLLDSGRMIAGTMTTVDVVVPQDACVMFGSDAPPPRRAVDPDATGGYYQPIRVRVVDHVVIGLSRVRCNLADAPVDIARMYRERYAPNHNPLGLAVESDAHDGTLERGRALSLTLRFAPESRESFVRYDRGTVSLVDQEERLTTTWFATAGSFDRQHSAPEPTPLSSAPSSTINRWQAPDHAGQVRIWAVLRDDRGGASVSTLDLVVR